MRKFLNLFLFLSVVVIASAQDIPSKANVIIVKGVGFDQVCNTLLDSGYSIEKKDLELHTVRTEPKQYPKYWNATYIIDIRVKDSIAYISGTFTAPPNGELFKNEPIANHADKKGNILTKSLDGAAFNWINILALSFNKPIEYKIQN